MNHERRKLAFVKYSASVNNKKPTISYNLRYEWLVMDKVRTILTAITIAINVAPLLGVLLINQNDLLGLAVLPEIHTIVNEVSSLQEHLEESFENAIFVDSQYDPASRIAKLSYEIANPMPFDLLVNSMSAKIQCETHQFPIGQTIIREPVTIKSGESAILDFSGTWSHEAVKHLLEEHAGKEEVNVELTEILLEILMESEFELMKL